VLTGPYTLARLSVDQHYGSVEALATAFAEALNQEAKALQQAGAAHIQFNEPAILQHKDDFPVFAAVCRRLVEGITAETGLYLYFGDVDGIYPQVLDLPVDLIGLDFCAGRANEQLLHRSPFTKKLGLGIVDARNSKLEPAEQIAERIRALSGNLPHDHIHVSPSAGLEFLPREVAQEKLRRMAQAVRQAEGVLV
jgi:5-methyltetrahydropteroyltriglutamate--homocysteine methyltransferase